MEKWRNCPFVLQRRFCFTLVSGVGSLAISFIIYLISSDRILLGLGSAIFIFCLFRVSTLWHIVSFNDYEIIDGVCIGVASPPLRKYRRIKVMNETGEEITLLLNKQARINIGMRYRFYFQNCSKPVVGNEYLDMSLAANTFLGYEEIGEFK